MGHTQAFFGSSIHMGAVLMRPSIVACYQDGDIDANIEHQFNVFADVSTLQVPRTHHTTPIYMPQRDDYPNVVRSVG